MYDVETTVDRFVSCLRDSERSDSPYAHWLLEGCLPDEVIDAVIDPPIMPPKIGVTPQLSAIFTIFSIQSPILLGKHRYIKNN